MLKLLEHFVVDVLKLHETTLPFAPNLLPFAANFAFHPYNETYDECLLRD